jgi:protein-S-isoprenylcysteine O-methyltransferase Ste14
MNGDAYRKFAFRFRVLIFLLLYLLGFLAPWDRGTLGGNGTLWLAASTVFARSGWIGLTAATLTVTIIALGCLAAGAVLRVWGTAYLGSAVMRGAAMQGGQVVAAGPYRFVRNPLYLGSWLLALAVSILMPPSGAVFFLISTSIFILFLISAEERFLSARAGDAYHQYRRRVPRLLPRMGAGIAPSSAHPHWLEAILAETYPIGFTVCFAIFAWRYNARILIQCLLICYGLSLIGRAFTRRAKAEVSVDVV